MNCPKCNAKTKVVDRRSVRRRRECLVCSHRFSTIEMLASEAKEVSKEVKQTPVIPKPPKPPKEKVTVSAIKRQANARRKLEDLREMKILDDFDYFDDDSNFIPEKW